MRKKLVRRLIFIVLILALTVGLGLSAHADSDFGCSFADANGNGINGFCSERDGCWYLFVPSNLKLEELNLQLRGEVSAVSAGSYDSATGVLSGAFAQGSEITVTCGGQELRLVALQSDLPSVHIILNGASLDQVHLDKDEKYKDNSVYISSADGSYTLAELDNVELKGRGNSTWRLYEKKAYQIKFDSKIDLMGMGKAKKWVLLANASDDSMLRSQLVYRLAEQLGMDFVPEFEYVDLWINGDYRGSYLIGEKIELGGSRLDLEDSMGVLFEQDDAFYAEEDYWFYSEYLQRHFVLKESVEEDDEALLQSAIDSFALAVDEFADFLFSTPSRELSLEALGEYIDVESFAKYYLINEYTLNREAFVTSFYWYRDGEDKPIHLGPIWDFDTCMGNDGASAGSNYGNAHVMFQYLLAAPQFRDYVLELKTQYQALFDAMDSDTDSLAAGIDASAEMNYLRWDVLGKPNPKGGSDFCATWEQAVSSLKSWLAAREGGFSVPRPYVVNADVSEDCSAMELNFYNGQSYGSLSFAVWSLDGGKDDLQWYSAQKQSDGSWACSVDLSAHNCAGLYQIDAVTGSGATVATGQNYVKEAFAPDMWLEGSLSADRSILTISLVGSDAENLRFAVWSDGNGQDDLAWYSATVDEAGVWSCRVPLQAHGNAYGIFHVHAYSGNTQLLADTLYVNRGDGGTALFADVSEDLEKVLISMEYDGDYNNVWFAVWSEAGGQDDLVWYKATVNGILWSCSIDVSAHGGEGDSLFIHAYVGKENPIDHVESLLVPIGEPAPEPPAAEPELELSFDPDSRQLSLKLLNASQYRQIWIPVWSNSGDQDDIVWYEPQKQADGSWTINLPLPEFDVYHIHVYGGVTSPDSLLYYTTLDAAAGGEAPPDGPEQPEPTGQPELEVSMSADGKSLSVVLKNASDAPAVWLPVWSDKNGQDDLTWYRPTKQADGSWTLTVDLEQHGASGAYHIHAYSGTTGPVDLIAFTTFVVEGYVENNNVHLSAVVDEENSTMTVTLTSPDEYDQLWFPVWSDENGQDDIRWYRPAKQADGSWSITVDLEQHASTGVYHIHAYTGQAQPTELLAFTTANVEHNDGVAIVLDVAVENGLMTITLTSPYSYEHVWMPVWSEADWQDDLRWYEPVFNGESWVVTVDLADHAQSGTIFVHVYSGIDRPDELIAHTAVVI